MDCESPCYVLSVTCLVEKWAGDLKIAPGYFSLRSLTDITQAFCERRIKVESVAL